MTTATLDTAPILPGMAYARLLAHSLARITRAPAYVIDDDGHPMLACEEDINVYWTPAQIVFTAPAPEGGEK